MTAAELRAQADALEAAEKDAAIRERCRFQGFEWKRNGDCYAVYTEFVQCSGYNGQKHHKSYSDEYGSRHSCRGCNGSGQNFIHHYLRRPEYDAPETPKEDK